MYGGIERTVVHVCILSLARKLIFNFMCMFGRTAIQENIDSIRLQREVKEKSTKLTQLQGQYAQLEEVIARCNWQGAVETSLTLQLVFFMCTRARYNSTV